MSVYAGPEVITNGLIGHWDGGNLRSYPGSGTAWNDLSGNGYNGTLTNGPTFSNNVITFDGTNDYCNVSSTSGSTFAFPNTTFTASAWIKTSWTGATTVYFMAKDLGTTGSGWGLGLSIPGVTNATVYGLTAHAKGAGGAIALFKSSVKAINDGIWHNVVTVITTNTTVTASNSATLYIDGNVDNGNLATATTPYIAPTSFFEIGRRSSGSYFPGSIANVSIYNRALSAAEVSQNFNALRGRFSI